MSSAELAGGQPFSPAALHYFNEHAIDPDVAARLGVFERGGQLWYPFKATDGERFYRRRRLGPTDERGVPIETQGFSAVWWLTGHPRPDQVVLCAEGEANGLAVQTAIERSTPRMFDVCVCVVPDSSFSAERLVDALAETPAKTAFLCFDGDDEARTLTDAALQIGSSHPAVPEIVPVALEDGIDMAHFLGLFPPPAYDSIENLLADALSAHEARVAEEHAAVPIDQRLDEIANGERFVAQHGWRLRFCTDTERWLRHDGVRWREADGTWLKRRAMETARSIHREAEHATAKDAKLLREWARKSASKTKLASMIDLAAAEESIAIHSGELDTHDMLLCVRNGVVDLSTGKLAEHDSDLLLTQMTDIAYDGMTGSDVWEDLLLELCGGDASYVEWLGRAVGYSLTARTDEELLFVLHGPGGTGKSTLLSTLENVWGDYARTAHVETIVRQSAGRPRNDIARLAHARLVTIGEGGIDEQTDAELLKRLTGGDTLTARFLYGEHIEFRPRLKLWMASNHMPRAASRDTGMFRRIRVLPFTHRPAVVRHQLKKELSNRDLHGPGILGWAVAGCLRWQRRRLSSDVPAAVRDATDAFQLRSDPIGWWLRERVTVDPEARVPARELYDAFAQVAGEHGLSEVPSEKRFAERLAREGVARGRSSSTRYWEGLRPS